MSYTFRVVFSGPCAYLPNIVEGDEGPATSWSVVLPYMKNRWPGERDGDKISVDSHLAVVQFSEAQFQTSVPPDIRLAVRNDEDERYQESGLYLLDGHRITFDLPGAETLKVVEQKIDPKVMSDQDAVLELLKNADPKTKSMSWLPAMSWLRKNLQWFGRDGIAFFQNGFPQKGTLAGHVLLKQGSLVAHEIDTVPKNDGTMVPTIWEFRPPGTRSNDKNPRQALAKSIALEVNELKKPVTVTIAFSPDVKKTLTLKAKSCKGVVEIQIKNRELEEIFLSDSGEFESHPVDLDFRYMYTQAQGYDPKAKYPLPCLFEGGDAGNERGTCGGHRFSGYSKAQQATVKSW
ncbi:MAG: hypothetical protein WAM82_16950 [Thermoanaerobaculia bacterium]